MVRMIDSGDKLKLDQSHVETVIPAPGTALLLLNMILFLLKDILTHHVFQTCSSIESLFLSQVSEF